MKKLFERTEYVSQICSDIYVSLALYMYSVYVHVCIYSLILLSRVHKV